MRPAGFMVLSLALLAACGPASPGKEAAPAADTPALMAPPADAPSAYDANGMSPAEISAKLVGTFRYADDEKSILTIKSNGEWMETYEGSQSPTASWRVFAGDQPPKDAEETFTPASRYLEVIGEAGTFYYELGIVADDDFDMFYVGRGNMLRYVRVKVPA